MHALRQRSVLIGASVLIATGAYVIHQHVEYVKMHTIPAGLQAFDVNGPIPSCGRWKDTMTKTRDLAAYRLYINARKLWRSKIEWQFTRQELTSILNDVQAAANQVRRFGKRLKAWNRTVYYVLKWCLFGALAFALFWC